MNRMGTPWGTADRVTELADGVYSVSTPSHGGIMVRLDVAERDLSEQARGCSIYGGRFGDFLCYEEDCEWAFPMYEHPEWDRANWTWRYPGLTEEECVSKTREEAAAAIACYSDTYKYTL